MKCVCMYGKVEASDERIDMDKLKVRDKISFYSDIILFEDELHDSGCSMLSVKIVCRLKTGYLTVTVKLPVNNVSINNIFGQE